MADLYKMRWRIELFFKWIKQNLKIKRFLGTSKNAVLIQITVAIIVYLLLRLVQQSFPNSQFFIHAAMGSTDLYQYLL
ncbi:transposase [Nitrosomonas sp. Nm166]|uniref:transposase n=1 Tax=Nitrosomonas sp. Nm166 TaxID=1881054 RepID=UPI00210E9CC0|nr:transposase [Nitrosomonas sp. Nm166]